MMKKQLVAFIICWLMVFPLFAATPHHEAPYLATQESLKNITPQAELLRLKEGNKRFVNNKALQRDLLHQAKVTSTKGQFPAAIILSCMDSRAVPELILDQGLGDIFSVRVAGNVVDQDQIASMEYATKVIGTKLIVVMGHTHCGAIKGACESVQLGNLTKLLDKIQPSVDKIETLSGGKLDCKNSHTIDQIAKQNVLEMMDQITKNSVIINEQIDHHQVLIVGAVYDLQTSKVVFFNENGENI